MAHRRMSPTERSLASLMARSKLDGGEAPDSVAFGISDWLRAARGWNGKNAADRRARELVAREVEHAAYRAKCRAMQEGIRRQLAERDAKLARCEAALRAVGVVPVRQTGGSLALCGEQAEKLADVLERIGDLLGRVRGSWDPNEMSDGELDELLGMLRSR